MKNKILTHKWISLSIILLIIISISGLVYAVTNKDSQTESQDSTNQAVVNANNNTEEQPIPTTVTENPEPVTPPPAPTAVEPKPPVAAPKWPVQLTSAQASSLAVVVNKKHKLPSTYTPATTTIAGGSLRPEAANAFNTMISEANTNGVSLIYGSGYRSYARQAQLYNNYVANDGQAAADTYSARPGHSEHQTGLAVDVKGSSCYLETCFADTTEGKWVAENAYKYGFIIRYPKGKDAITGYQYEPWHLRYLGVNEATAVFNSGKTLEEYYYIPSGGYN